MSLRYPFSDLSSSKVRPAVVVSAVHPSKDVFVVALTSKTDSLMEGEFLLLNWSEAGLNVATVVKRGLYTVYDDLIIKSIGSLSEADAQQLELSLRGWLGL